MQTCRRRARLGDASTEGQYPSAAPLTQRLRPLPREAIQGSSCQRTANELFRAQVMTSGTLARGVGLPAEETRSTVENRSGCRGGPKHHTELIERGRQGAVTIQQWRGLQLQSHRREQMSDDGAGNEEH